MYIPIGILLTVLIFEKFQIEARSKGLLAMLCMVIIVGVSLAHDKTFCYVDNYDYRPISQGFLAVKDQRRIPTVEYVGSLAAVNNGSRKITYANDAVINIGMSYLWSRSSLFGYKFEYFPQKERLKVGRVDRISAGSFNLKNPSCYLYPNENNCNPGDHFRSDQSEALIDFVNYRSFRFQTPPIQRIANGLSVIALLVCLTLFGIHLTWRCLKGLPGKLSFRPNSRNYIHKKKLTNARPERSKNDSAII
jgi:hypothetical protein